MNEWSIEKNNPQKHLDNNERPNWKQWWHADDSACIDYLYYVLFGVFVGSNDKGKSWAAAKISLRGKS